MHYSVEPSTKPSITSVGRMDRKESYQCVIALPPQVKQRLDEIIEGGSITAAIAGLVMYALDEIETRKHRLQVRI